MYFNQLRIDENRLGKIQSGRRMNEHFSEHKGVRNIQRTIFPDETLPYNEWKEYISEAKACPSSPFFVKKHKPKLERLKLTQEKKELLKKFNFIAA